MNYIQRASAQKNPLRFALSRVLWRSGLCRFLIIDRGSYRLHFFPSTLSAELWADGAGRKNDEHYFAAYLEPGDTVIDIGANIGTLTLTASTRVGERGHVYAIEPHPQVYQYLNSNIKLNKRSNITTLNFALSNESGELCFSNMRSDDCNGVVADSSLKVKSETLDFLIGDQLKRVALLKVDVEGFEKFVFEGASGVLSRTECVYFEAWDQHFGKFGYSTNDILELLRRHGFRIFRLSSGDHATHVPADFHAMECENLIAVKNVEDFSRRTGFLIKEVSTV